MIDGGRLDIPPQAPGLVLSEGFPGLMDYIALIHSCWAQEPQARPSLSHIIAELRWVFQTIKFITMNKL